MRAAAILAPLITCWTMRALHRLQLLLFDLDLFRINFGGSSASYLAPGLLNGLNLLGKHLLLQFLCLDNFHLLVDVYPGLPGLSKDRLLRRLLLIIGIILSLNWVSELLLELFLGS